MTLLAWIIGIALAPLFILIGSVSLFIELLRGNYNE